MTDHAITQSAPSPASGPSAVRPERDAVEARAAELAAARTPFARATVVRAQAPTSTRPGDLAVVTADGTMAGFVGGQCTVETVRLAAVQSISDGESVLLRILPAEHDAFPEVPGARVSVNSCLSQGAAEVFVQPVLPAPIIHIAGAMPIAHALAAQADLLGFEVRQSKADLVGVEDVGPQGALASVIATHGGPEPAAIREALSAGVGYVGLVASPARGAGVLAELDLDPTERSRIHTPAGVEIGALTPAEIALSIMAEVVAKMRAGTLSSAAPAAGTEAATPEVQPMDPTDTIEAVQGPGSAPQTAVDPICQMTVVIMDTTPTATVDGVRRWFCCTGCRDQFLAEAAL